MFQRRSFNKSIITVLFSMVAFAPPVLADIEALEDACYDGDTPVEERVAACAALIETEGFEDLAQAIPIADIPTRNWRISRQRLRI